MAEIQFIWDLEDDREGNYWHICVEGHGITQEDVEEVIRARPQVDALSRTSGQPMTFGWTSEGKYIAVVWELVEEDPLTVFPITAFPAKLPKKEEEVKTKNVPRKVNWTAEDRARHEAVREKFKNWHPSLEELLATGDYVGPIPHGAYLDFCVAMRSLKVEREKKGLSLAKVSQRSGMDVAAISRLENGKLANPTLDTLFRYMDALGKQLVWVIEDLPKPTKGTNGPPPIPLKKRKR